MVQVPESQELCRYSTGCFAMACSTGCFAMACSTGCSVLMKSMCENSWVHLLDSAGCLFSTGHGAGNLHMCHLAEKGVKVVMPLVLWVQYTGARTWFKGCAICCSVSCHRHCAWGQWRVKKTCGWCIHLLLGKTRSKQECQLQMVAWLCNAARLHHHDCKWHCAGFWQKKMSTCLGHVRLHGAKLPGHNGLEMDSSLASSSSMMDLSMAVVFWMAAASCPTTLFFLSMEKQFGKIPWFEKLEATCNRCFLIIGQPRSFQVARHFSTCLAKASGVAKWCQVAWNNSTNCTKSWKQWAAALWAVSSALMASKNGPAMAAKSTILKLCKRTWRTSCVCQLFFVERVLQAWNCGRHVAHASKKANPPMWPSNPRLQANCKCKGARPLGTTKHASNHGKWFWLGAQLPARICLPGLHVVKKWSHKLAPISWIGQLTQWWTWWLFWPSCPKFQHLG